MDTTDPPPATMAVTGATPLHLASYVVLDRTAVLACRADRVRIRPLLCHNPNKGTGDAFAFRSGRERVPRCLGSLERQTARKAHAFIDVSLSLSNR